MNLVPLPVVIPLGVAFLLAAVHRHLPSNVSRTIATLAALASCVISIRLTLAAMQIPIVYWMGGWTPRSGVAIGIDFYVDPISGTLASLTSFLSLAAFVYSRSIEEVGTLFDVLMLGFLSAMCGFAFSGDVFNLFVFFELMSAAAFALCGYKLQESSVTQGAFNFAITNTIGAFFGLMGIGLLYASTGALNLAQIGNAIGRTPNTFVITSFVLLVTGFLVKSGTVPFHFWLADAHAVAPTPVCLLFSGVMVELGLYAVARIYWTAFDGAFSIRAPVSHTFMVFGILSAVVGALMSFGQRNIKRLLAFSTVSHVGLMMLGFALLSADGIAGLLMYIVGHGLIKGSLFLNAGVLLHRFQSVDELELHGKGRKLRVCGVLFAIGGIMLAGAPITAMFLGEHAISHAAEQAGLGWIWVIFIFAEVVTAAAVLRVTGCVFHGLGKAARATVGARKIPEQRETKSDGDRVPAWMLIPQIVMLSAAFGCMLMPSFPHLCVQSARLFVERPSYYGLVILNAVPSLGTSTAESGALAPSLFHSLLATALAIALAGLALSRWWPSEKSFLYRASSPIQFVRKLHSGHVGDYVAFLVFGIACFAGLLWIQVR